MTDQPFSEREIKEKLDNLEVPYNPASWEKMEARLNAPFTEEDPVAVEAVDKFVQPKLARLEPAYNEQHWKIMAARLRLIAARRRQVVSTKLLETAIVLLVLGNLPTWLGFQPPMEQQILIPRNQAVAEWNDAGKNPSEGGFSIKNPGARVDQNEVSRFDQNEAYRLREVQSRASYPVGSEDNASERFLNPSNFEENGAPTSPSISLPEEVLNAIQDFFLNKTQAEKPAAPPLPIAENGLPEAGGFFENQNRFAKMASLDELETRNVFVDGPTAQPFLPFAYHFEKTKPRQLQVGIFAAPETNIIRTPSTEYGKADNVQMVHGYAFGLAFGQKKGRIGYETGLIYQAKNLDRREINVYGNLQDGFVKQLLDRQEYEIVGIPVRVTAKIARLRHVTISARCGFSANAIVQKNNVRQKLAVPKPAVPNSAGPLALYRKNKEEQNGLFEGGSLNENGFLTADAGLRFERPVGGRMSVFFEPVAQHSIKNGGLGLRKDKLSTFSWQVGMTATL